MIRAQVLKQLLVAGEGKKRGSCKDARRDATAGETVKKDGGVRVIERKKARGNDSIKNFFPTRV